MSRSLICIAVSLFAFVAMPSASAQEASASLEGTVINAEGEFRFEGARVRLLDTNRRTSTDRKGEFRFRELSPGTYEIEVSYVGAARKTETVEVVAGEENRVEIRLGGTSELDRLVVVGQAAVQSASLAREQSALNNINVLSADAIGQFPDDNVAEALQRVPGLSLERDQGEGRFVVIRGANAEFNTTTINGLRIPGPEDDSRAVNLDVVSSELVESVEITKSLLPDQDADAVGGNIEIKTLSAFDLGNSFRGRVEGSYNEPLEETSPRMSMTGTRLFSVGNGTDNLAVSGSVNYYDRAFAVDNVEAGEWPLIETPAGEMVRSPEAAEQRDYELERRRVGGVLNFDYRTDGGSELYLRTLYSEFSDNEVELEHEYLFEDSTPVEISADAGLYTDGEVERRGKETTATREILSLVFGGESTVGQWDTDYQAGYSEASTSEPFSLGTALIAEGLDIGYDLGGDRRRPRLFGSDLDQLENLEAYELDLVELESDLTEEEEISLAFNAGRYYSWGSNPGRLKFGGKIRLREKFNDANNFDFESFGGDFTLADLAGAGSRDYPLGRFGPYVDTRRLRQFYFDNRDNFEFDQAGFLLDSEGEDYELEEDIYAAYVMSEVSLGSLDLMAGVRIEHTDQSQAGFRSLVNEDVDDGIPTIEPYSGSNEYTDFFPNLQARFNISDEWQLRAALTRTMGRPNFEDAGARQLVEIEGGDRVAEIGNPDLDPFYSNNFDLEFSYYAADELTVASAGFFYKDIDDFFVSTDIAGEAPWQEFDEVSTVINGDSAELFGIELSFVQQFGFLPSPWDGLLLIANYTYVDSEASVSFRDGNIPLPQQSDNIANLALGYDGGGMSLRLAANYRGEYFDEIEDPEDPSQDRYVDDELRVDFTSEYQFSDNWTAIFNVSNLTDEVFYAYLGDRRYANQYDEFGRTYEFGLRFQY
ncbi:TonB-dependent receptor [Wenzhouxiangella sp. EGI_FJ10409]|uniref:TonB-dependent receptor n=1 Tax=Wenzhouxiangella sp. EGI_FJ10409 TaxID=3243767 RepID=UPI0035DF63A0